MVEYLLARLKPVLFRFLTDNLQWLRLLLVLIRCIFQIDGKYILNHPLDLIYDTSTSEGWPLFVCEAWTRSENARGFYGCGAIFLPTSPGKHSLDVMLWRPASQGLANLTNILLPELPDLRSLRELILNPYLRSQLTVESMGAVSLSMFVTTSGFEEFGVFLEQMSRFLLFAFIKK